MNVWVLSFIHSFIHNRNPLVPVCVEIYINLLEFIPLFSPKLYHSYLFVAISLAWIQCILQTRSTAAIVSFHMALSPSSVHITFWLPSSSFASDVLPIRNFSFLFYLRKLYCKFFPRTFIPFLAYPLYLQYFPKLFHLCWSESFFLFFSTRFSAPYIYFFWILYCVTYCYSGFSWHNFVE